MSISINNNLTDESIDIISKIHRTGHELDADSEVIKAAIMVANAESDFVTTAQNPLSSAYGLFQYLYDGDPNNGSQSSWETAWSRFTRDHSNHDLASLSISDAWASPDAQIAAAINEFTIYHDDYPNTIDPNWQDEVDQLVLDGYNPDTNFTEYAYLRHNTDLTQVKHIYDTAFTPENYEAVESLFIAETYDTLDSSFTTTFEALYPYITDATNSGHVLSDIIDSFVEAGTAVTEFVEAQVSALGSWFTNPGGANVAFANWLGTNMQDLVDGTLDIDDAFIDLAEYLAVSFGTRQLTDYAGLATDRLKADALMTDVLKDLGVSDDAALSTVNIFAQTLSTFTTQIITDGYSWDSTDYANAGITAFAGALSYNYARTYFGDVSTTTNGTIYWNLNATQAAQINGTVAAVTTLVAGILSDPSLNTEEYLLLGAQTGIAAASAATTAAINTALGVSTWLGPAGIVAGALVSVIGGKILGSLFGSKKFYKGEYGSMSALIDSIYTVEQVDDGMGGTVDALVATNPEGSVILLKSGYTTAIGGSGPDNLVGTAADDLLIGNGDADYLEGKDGDDTLMGGGKNDHMIGGDGDDVLIGGGGNDEIFGDEGDDIIMGDDGEDFIMGGAGEDAINGGDGQDIILAGNDVDVVDGGADRDVIDLGEGDDFASGGDGEDVIMGNIGNDNIDGDGGNDQLFGEEGNDQIDGGSGSDYLDGGNGIDVLTGGTGMDVLIGGDGQDALDGGIGNDRLHGGLGSDLIIGGLDNDLLIGDLGDDDMQGGFGEDILEGSDGDDTLDGGEGDDYYFFLDGDDDDTIIDSDGTDTIVLGDVDSSTLSFSQDVDDLVVTYGADAGTIRIQDHFAGTGFDVEKLETEDGYVDLTAITFPGGVASYSVLVDPTPSFIKVNAEIQSFNSYQSRKSAELTANGLLGLLGDETYTEAMRNEILNTYYNGSEIEVFKRKRGFFGGSYKVYRVGRDLTIEGDSEVTSYTVLNPGDDTSPYDAVVTGTRVTFVLDDYVFEDIWLSGEVISTTLTSTRYGTVTTLAAGAEYIYANTTHTAASRLASGTSESVDIGELLVSEGHDQIVGTYVGETINGNAGDDNLYGGDGEDTINGNDGNDWIFGGDNGDTIDGGDGDDLILGGNGADTIYGGDGDDAIIGGAGDDLLYGNGGNDWIDGGEGNDIIVGGAGDDAIYGQNNSDGAKYNDAPNTIEANLLYGTVVGYGNDILLDIEHITASSFDDVVRGSSVYNFMNLGSGDDLAYGEGGDDILKGFAGNDILYGGVGDDELDGGDDDDILYGEDGTDTLTGGNGNDIFYADLSDIIYADFTTGTDTMVTSDESATVAQDNIRFFVYEGGTGTTFKTNNSAGIIIAEGEKSHTLMGLNAFDVFYAGRGNDTMYGSGGNDTVIYTGVYSDYSVTKVSSTELSVTDNETGDTDTIYDVERLLFSDKNYYLSSGATVDKSYTSVDIDYTSSFTNSTAEINTFALYDTHNFSAPSVRAFDGDFGDVLIMEGLALVDQEYYYEINSVIYQKYVWGIFDILIDVDIALNPDDAITALSRTGDVFVGDDYINYHQTGAGDDLLIGNDGDDVFDGNTGDDVLIGGDDEDLLIGGAGTDYALFTKDYADYTIVNGPNADTKYVDDNATTDRNETQFVEVLKFANGTYDIGTSTFTAIDYSLGALTDLTDSAPDIQLLDLEGSYDYTANIVYRFAGDTTDTIAFDPTLMVLMEGAAKTIGAVTYDHYVYGLTDFLIDQDIQIDTTSVLDNQAPDTRYDTFSGNEDAAITGNVFADNGSGADTDPEGDSFSVILSSVVAAAYGSVTMQSNGDFVYMPNADFNGADTFSYTVIDTYGGESTAHVYIDVTAVNDAPTAVDDDFDDVVRDVAYTGNLLADNGSGLDWDVDGDTLSVVAETIASANGGTVVIQSNGDFTYTSEASFYGTDSFTYTLQDPSLATSIGTVTLEVDINSTEGDDTNNTINGTSSADYIFAYDGSDTVYGNGGNDYIDGGKAADVIEGGNGDDTIIGWNGADTLDGDAGDDTIYGNGGADVIDGGADDDFIYGGLGADDMTGGAGADTFIWEDGDVTGSLDQITDFDTSEGDVIDFADVLTAYDPLSDDIADFVQISDDGTDSLIEIDLDGTGGTYSFVDVVQLDGVINLDLSDMITNGELLVA